MIDSNFNRTIAELLAERNALAAKLDAAESALNDAILYAKEGRDALARQTPVLLAAEATLKRVRALHQPCACNMCKENPSCEMCDSMAYPCATIRALDGES